MGSLGFARDDRGEAEGMTRENRIKYPLKINAPFGKITVREIIPA